MALQLQPLGLGLWTHTYSYKRQWATTLAFHDCEDKDNSAEIHVTHRTHLCHRTCYCQNSMFCLIVSSGNAKRFTVLLARSTQKPYDIQTPEREKRTKVSDIGSLGLQPQQIFRRAPHDKFANSCESYNWSDIAKIWNRSRTHGPMLATPKAEGGFQYLMIFTGQGSNVFTKMVQEKKLLEVSNSKDIHSTSKSHDHKITCE